VWRFAADFAVPFTSSNPAEQPQRMVKLQMKIGGCWRSVLVMRAPAGLRFVLATQHDVRLGLYRLRLEGS
jgi:transposase